MSDTPRIDAFLRAGNCSPHNPVAFEWAIGLARSIERELKERTEERNAALEDTRKADEMLMRWFKAASPYATPGSLEEGLKKMERELAEAQNVMSDLPKEHMGEYERMEEYRRQKEMPSKEVLDAITQGRETGFALGLREAAEVAEHYAKLMNSEAAQRAADEIRAMLSESNQ